MWGEKEKMFYLCFKCQSILHVDEVNIHLLSDGSEHWPHCPHCDSALHDTLNESPKLHTEPDRQPAQYSDFLPDEEQLGYLKYIVTKQARKVNHAVQQLNTLLTKIDIMSEVAKEHQVNKEKR